MDYAQEQRFRAGLREESRVVFDKIVAAGAIFQPDERSEKETFGKGAPVHATALDMDWGLFD